MGLDPCLDYVFICHGLPFTMVLRSTMGKLWSPASGGEWTFVLGSLSQFLQLPETVSPVFLVFPSHLFLLIYTYQKTECHSHCFQSMH